MDLIVMVDDLGMTHVVGFCLCESVSFLLW